MKHCDERPKIEGDERDFADRLAAHYAPPPWSSAERAGFDEALRARIERPRRHALALPALAAVAAAALVWVSVSIPPAPEESEPALTSVWESELFLSSDVSPLEDRDESEALPDDYLTIASLFLDG